MSSLNVNRLFALGATEKTTKSLTALQLWAVLVRMEDRRECSDKKIVSRCRERARRVYHGAVVGVKKGKSRLDGQEKSMNTRSILVGLCLFGLSLTAWGQNVNRPAGSGILGYLDPQTGTFRPVPLVTDNGSEDAPPVAPTFGKVVLNLKATLQTTFPTGETFSCGLSASTFESSGLSFTDSYQVAATVSGSTLTCTVTLPYYWALISRGSDTMTVSYSVTGVNGAPSGLPTRLAEHGVANLIVPVSGTTTTYSFWILL
jgi:hypothetical protein